MKKKTLYEVQCRKEYNWTTVFTYRSKEAAVIEAKARSKMYVDDEFRVVPVKIIWESKRK